MPPTLRQRVGLWLGLIIAIGLQFVPLPQSLIDSVGGVAQARQGWIVFALLAVMVTWWISEAIPIPVTSLLPMVVLPFFGVMSLKATAAEYMNPVVVLLLGGFIIAKAIERWNLHERLALTIVARMGANPALLIAGFMVAAALLSMWISNTATSIMMVPIALSVAAALLGKDRLDAPFTYALLLGIAYACSIGGLATPVGTPTNLIIIGYLNQEAGFSIDFLQWMTLGIPVVLLLLPAAWLVLTQWAFKLDGHYIGDGQAVVKERLLALGPITRPELRTLGVFAVVAVLWIFKQPLQALEIARVHPFAGMTDHMIAIFGVILCFLVPSGSSARRGSALLDWPTAEAIPWGVLLLFGGGLSLAASLTQTGLGEWLGGQLSGLVHLPILVLIAVLTTFVIFATEVTSNVATATALMPVVGATALATGINVELLAAPIAMAASCAFMLPMATGPNAVVFATGHVSLPTMAVTGLRLNLVGIVLITGAVYLLVPVVLG